MSRPADRREELARELMTPAEVAQLFRVDAKTVTRWANKGLLPSVRTLGNHRRFRRAAVLDAVAAAERERR